MFLTCVSKTSPFLSAVCSFHTSQIKLLPNHQYLYVNIDNSVNENASVVHSVFLFEKIGVSFYNYYTEEETLFSLFQYRKYHHKFLHLRR